MQLKLNAEEAKAVLNEIVDFRYRTFDFMSQIYPDVTKAMDASIPPVAIYETLTTRGAISGITIDDFMKALEHVARVVGYQEEQKTTEMVRSLLLREHEEDDDEDEESAHQNALDKWHITGEDITSADVDYVEEPIGTMILPNGQEINFPPTGLATEPLSAEPEDEVLTPIPLPNPNKPTTLPEYFLQAAMENFPMEDATEAKSVLRSMIRRTLDAVDLESMDIWDVRKLFNKVGIKLEFNQVTSKEYTLPLITGISWQYSYHHYKGGEMNFTLTDLAARGVKMDFEGRYRLARNIEDGIKKCLLKRAQS